MKNFPVTKEGATMPESHRRDAAQAFIASADWKVLSLQAGKSDPTDEEPAPVLAVWFAKGMHESIARDVMELLGEQASVKNPVIGGVVQPGLWYHRTAEYKRDGGVSAKGGISFTLYRTMGGGADGFSKVTENGCTTTTTVEYKWDQAIVEDAPEQEQGFNYKIGGVTQNPLTKLFSYSLSKIEQHTFHNTSVRVVKTELASTYVESWTGLRGTKSAPTDDDGDSVSVPDSGDQTDGTLIRTEWVHDNQFCTWSARVTKVVAKKGVTLSESCARDQFRHADSTTVSGEAAALGHAPAPVDGLTKKYSSRLREDGLRDNTTEDNQELAVEDAEVSSSKDLYKEEVASLDRQVSTATPSASVSDGVLTQVSVSKTPGKRKNIKTSVHTEKNVADANVSKSATIFETSTEAQEKSSSVAPDDPVAGDGQTQNVSVSKTPGDRKDISISTRVEVSVNDASVSEDVDLFHKRTSSVDRNSAAAVPAASSGSGVGVSISAERTPGGRRNIHTKRDEEKFVNDASVSRQATIFEITSQTTDQNSSGSAPGASAGGGILVSSQTSKTPHGRRNIAVSTKSEQAVSDATVSDSGDIFHTVDENGDVNVEDPGGLISTQDTNVLRTRSRSKTPGGRSRVSNKVVTFKPVDDAAVRQTGNLRENSESHSYVNQLATPTDTTGFVSAGDPILSLQSKKTPAGGFDYTKNTDTPTEFRSYEVRSVVPGTDLYEYVITFMNATDADVATLMAKHSDFHIVPSYGWNKYALMEGSIKFIPWVGFGGSVSDFMDETDKVENQVDIVTIGGVPYIRVTRSTFSIKRDGGVSSGLSVYSGALNGSTFRSLGKDWYFYKKVTNIKINHTAISDITDEIEETST